MEGWKIVVIIIVVILLLIFVVGPLLSVGLLAFAGHEFTKKEGFYIPSKGWHYDLIGGKEPNCGRSCIINSVDAGNSRTLRDCENTCTSTKGCKSFTYDFSNNRCGLNTFPNGTKLTDTPLDVYTGVRAPNL